jgi:titin
VANQNGVVIFSGSKTLIGGPGAGNVISGNSDFGIQIFANGNQVQANYIGTNAAGDSAIANGTGIFLSGSNTTVGGGLPGFGNLISGNSKDGVEILGSGNFVEGNLIGTDWTGSSRAVPNENGVHVSSGSNNDIGGDAPNVISGNTGDGVFISNGTVTRVQGNLIGTNAAGTQILGNRLGIEIRGAYNLVGGTRTGNGNIISGNSEALFINGPGNRVEGNYVGTDVTGTVALGNEYGVEINLAIDNIIGGTAAGAGNVISGNHVRGLFIGATGNLVQGNYIGADRSGTKALGNALGLVIQGGFENVIGGVIPEARNLISGNLGDGIVISGSQNTIQGNLIGTDVTGTTALMNSGNGLLLNLSYRNVIGGTVPGARNVISGNAATGIALDNRADSDTIQGNFIGTDLTGTKSLANQDGIFARGAVNIVIGGTMAGAGNVISGNRQRGVELFMGSTGDVLQGNYIGTDATGTQVLGNSGAGIEVDLDSNATLIGGTSTGARNVISGNQGDGVYLASGVNAWVFGNYIGTDVTGTMSLGNRYGVSVLTKNTTIGGTAAGNLISGNREYGIYLSSDSNEHILGNLIGTDASGTQALGNGSAGIYFLNGTDVTIGGTAAGAGNVIAANMGDGIYIQGASTANITVQGNYIGTDVTGTLTLGNTGNGVTLTSGAHDNTIGGTITGAGNTIAFNSNDGVLVDTGKGNAVRRNVIMGHNTGLGIELLNNGNNSQAYPVLSSAVSDGSSTTIVGSLTSTPSTTFNIEFFADTVCNPSGYGEGERYLESTTVTTDANGNADFTFTVAIPVDPGQFISATATDPNGNTSQFSACVVVTQANFPDWTALSPIPSDLRPRLTPVLPSIVVIADFVVAPVVDEPPNPSAQKLDQYFTDVTQDRDSLPAPSVIPTAVSPTTPGELNGSDMSAEFQSALPFIHVPP